MGRARNDKQAKSHVARGYTGWMILVSAPSEASAAAPVASLTMSLATSLATSLVATVPLSWWWAAGLLALLGYACALLAPTLQPAARTGDDRSGPAAGAVWSAPWAGEAWAARGLALGWLAHGVAIVVDVGGLAVGGDGARFGFASALSATIWLVLGVYGLESRRWPLQGARRVLAGLGMVAVGLAQAYPGEFRAQTQSAWAPLHWLLGLASYGLFGAAVLHAVLQGAGERRLRGKLQATPQDAAGLPLLMLERLTFRFVWAGFVLLSLAIALGWWTSPQWRWDHKSVFSLLGWAVFLGLLGGRKAFGWRGRRAARWLYAGSALLLLAYVGSRFVLEVILHRAAGAS
jgi:ABC-type uncharacterized transport system permease subunit